MLIKIREKAQGVFAWIILIGICVPFALWGIQNYLDFGKEASVASVGDKDFYQRDVNRAYAQFSQNLQGLGLDEQTIRQQALEKLIRDEVLLQYVQSEKLMITDKTARDFIRDLDYFKVEGKFDKKQFQALLSSQGMSSGEFINRIKNALMMEQFQRSILDSSFATEYDIESFFKIQNQKRDVEYLTVSLDESKIKPTEEEVEEYYQKHIDNYKTPEQIRVEYIDLSVNELAKSVEVSDEKLKSYYQEQKDLYTSKERRKISHILFAVNDNTSDEDALEKAKQAKARLEKEEFVKLAEELSDDKLTAKTGGDLGLFEVGVMEKAFEDAASALALNETSEPVKSSYGYHLIKVTELVPAKTKSFDVVKEDVKKAYTRAEAENTFYELGETLTEMSFEHPESLQDVSEAIGVDIKKTDFFSRANGLDIASDAKVRDIAFSEEVLQGNNSEPIELASDRVVVLRKLEFKPAETKELADVKSKVTTAVALEKAKQIADQQAQELKNRILTGSVMAELAKEDGTASYKEIKGLTRTSTEAPPKLVQEIFKAAKPGEGGQPTVFTVELDSGNQAVVKIKSVKEGLMSEEDKAKMELAKKNIARAFGQTTFNAVIESLKADTDISIRSN